MRASGAFAIAGLLLLAGCGDKGSSLYIRPFAAGGVAITKLDLVVQQSSPLRLKLSDNVSELTYVDVEYQQYADLVNVTPPTFKFKDGEGADGADVTLKGLKVTSGYIPIKFVIRGTSQSRTVEVKVSGQTVPDSGPPPDKGPDPDVGPSPDKGPDPDVGPSPDVGMTPDA